MVKCLECGKEITSKSRIACETGCCNWHVKCYKRTHPGVVFRTAKFGKFPTPDSEKYLTDAEKDELMKS